MDTNLPEIVTPEERTAARTALPVREPALLVVDRSARENAADLAGTAADVVRRGPDGRWRYVLGGG